MNKLIHEFFSRLTDRIAVMLGSVVSSSFETFRAQRQAEQQSLLEKLARDYERDGETEVAQVLRERARRLASENPAVDAEAVLSNTVAASVDPGAISSHESSFSDDSPFPQLPGTSGRPKRRKTRSKKTNAASDEIDA